MRTKLVIQSFILLSITALSFGALAKGQKPVMVMDETLSVNQTIETIPFEAGTHIKILEHQFGAGSGSRTIIATRPGGTIQLGPVVMSGDSEVTIGFGPTYFFSSASNIGHHDTHHNLVQIKEKGFEITGVLQKPTRIEGVLFSAKNDLGYYGEPESSVQFFCVDDRFTGHCFQTATLENLIPIRGRVAEDTELDGVPTLAGDSVLFQGDGHPASIISARRYLPEQKRWEYRNRPMQVQLMHKGTMATPTIYVNEVTFTKHHRPSVIVPGFGQRLFGIPLGEPQSLEREALIVRPDGSFVVSMQNQAVYVYDGIPVGSAGVYQGDLKFNQQGFLREATLGGAYVYGGLLLKSGINLQFQEFHGVQYLSKASLGGHYSRYAYEGPYNGQPQVFLLGAEIDFNRKGLIEKITGSTTDNEPLKEEYRRTDRIIYPVQGI